MVSISKTGLCFAAALLAAFAGGAHATAQRSPSARRLQAYVRGVEAPAQDQGFRMVVIHGKDVSGRIYKKLGLPSLQYCWDTCVREEQCTGARWGVIQGDVAGLCLLLSGELSVKDLARPKTEDGKAIQVVAGRKQARAPKDSGT